MSSGGCGSVSLNFCCEMHGKGPCDGHFAKLRDWVSSYCTAGGLVDGCVSAKVAFDEGSAAAMQLDAPPHGSNYINEVVTIADLGPKPATITELADTGPDHNNFHISETYCMKSVMIPGAKKMKKQPGLVYDYGIADHTFSDRAASKRVSAKDGWVRSEETRIAAHRREWKEGKRDHEPEHEQFSLDKLQKRLNAQLHAGCLPKKTCRRLSIAARGAKLVKMKCKQREKSKRVTASCKALRVAARA